MQNEKDKVSDALKSTGGAVEILGDTISQQSQLRQQAMRDQEKLEKRQDEIENYQVQAFQEKLKNEVRTNVRSFVEDAGKALNEIKSSVNDIVARLMQNNNERLRELQDKKTEILLMQTRNESERGDDIARREAELKDAAIILDATNELI